MKNPFQVHFNTSAVEDLKSRLAQTRWPNEIENTKWEAGTNLAYLRELCDYWQHDYDWGKNETYLNSFQHYRSDIDETGIHFIFEKGKGKKALPLLLTHGYPDSFVRFLKLIPLLTADENGISFDLVIPSIPGFGFSDKPVKRGTTPKRIASLFYKLMTEELGYSRFFAQGGDWGSSITEQIAIQYPGALLGYHMTDIPYYHLFAVPPGDLTIPEKKFMEAAKKWQMTEGGYAMLQSSQPQTLGYGLNDSPAGLASWIIEKFYRWSDCNGNLENCFSKDELLTNLNIYWLTQTINAANRIYYETAQQAPPENFKKIAVPAAITMYPKDLVIAPREYADRIYNVQQWTEMKKGGHFAAMEQPELFSEDICKFANKIVAKNKAGILTM
jgi:pimeloyl-ACP methyl ester carboxylesterase